MTAIRLHEVGKRYGDVVALEGVSVELAENTIHGLLGRNGAGKTTLMQILTGQGFETSGTVEVFGEHPYENARVLSRVCLVKESQRYPNAFAVRHAMRAAELLYPNWDAGYAAALLDEFGLPAKRPIKKLSRGMLSAVGVVIGLVPAVLAPWVVLAAAFATNLATYSPIDAGSESSGALWLIYFLLLFAQVITITQFFPFVVGLSVTRRAFYAATTLVVLLQSLLYGVAMRLLAMLERATGGWGVDSRFFALPFLDQGNVVADVLVYVVPLAAGSFVGVFMGVVFTRWGQTGVYSVIIGSAVVLTGLALLATWQQWWPAVGALFTEQSTFALLAGYPLLIAALLAGAGWLVLRRATP